MRRHVLRTQVPASAKHTNNWSLEGVAGLPADGKLDLTKLGLGETSMRVRTGRNLKAFPLPGGMSQQDRCDMENVMLTAFKDLIKDPAYGGRYVSLTPGHECNISDDECVPSPLSLPPSSPPLPPSQLYHTILGCATRLGLADVPRCLCYLAAAAGTRRW